MQQICSQHRARVDIEHLAHAEVRVVIEKLVDPLQHVIIRLADATEVAGDGLRAAQMDVRTVRSLGVERLDKARPDDLHGGDKGGEVAIRFLLLHFAHTDESSRHQGALGDGALGGGNHPREILRRADLERHGKVILEPHDLRRDRPKPCADNP